LGTCQRIIDFPIRFLCAITIPDTRFKGMKKYYMVTFIMSIVWVIIFSNFMVWWATVFGEAYNIPDTVMGLTILAAGTSVPDMLTSVVNIKKGSANSAVSSSIGSNIFDITMGLPMPWFIWSCINGMRAMDVVSDSLLLSIVVLISMIGLLWIVFICSGWNLTPKSGVIYILF